MSESWASSGRSREIARALLCGAVAVAVLAACSGDDGKPSNGTSSGAVSATDAGGAVGAKKKNAEQGCTKNEDCESDICFIGGNQSFCTVKCSAADVATVCVAPFTGSCNKQGYCKRD